MVGSEGGSHIVHQDMIVIIIRSPEGGLPIMMMMTMPMMAMMAMMMMRMSMMIMAMIMMAMMMMRMR